jgi:hypothetical protein
MPARGRAAEALRPRDDGVQDRAGRAQRDGPADDRRRSPFPASFHVDGPRAALAFDAPLAARPLVARFEEIWATGEPGLTGTVLGL